MKAFLQALAEQTKGKRTYTIALVTIIYAAGQRLGLWEVDAEIVAILAALALATVRAAIADLMAETKDPTTPR